MKENVEKEAAFTLIELLLIVALFSVLVTAVVIGVRQASVKAKLTRIATDLSELRKVADDIYYQGFEGYANLCESQGGILNVSVDPRIETLEQDIERMGGQVICYADEDNYCISVDLPSTNWFYCLDSRGNFVRHPSNPCSDANSVCPLTP